MEQGNNSLTVSLAFHPPAGAAVVHQLTPDSMVIIGSDPHCGMQLKVDSVSPRHCMVRLSESSVIVSDWYSESGTFVNDQRISDETVLSPDDTLRLGPHEIQINRYQQRDIRTATPPAKPAESEAVVPNHPSPKFEVDPMPILPTAASLPLCADSIGEESEDLREQLDAARAEIQFLRDQQAQRERQSSNWIPVNADDVSGMQSELEILRAEVTQLQSELAEREQLTTDTWDAASDFGCEQQESEFSDTESLVNRLEQLLDELQSADRRILTLEDLLRRSEDASRAELDERQHLENWLGEIEGRVTQREQEGKAERERLEARINELIEQRQQIEAGYVKLQQGTGSAVSQQAIAELQQRLQQSTRELDASRQQVIQLQRQLDGSAVDLAKAARVEELEERARSQEVEITQERARLARQRVELEKAIADAESSTRTLANADDVDVRFRAFREHLRGLHEDEQKEKKERSLSARLARLWKRTDSR